MNRYLLKFYDENNHLLHAVWADDPVAVGDSITVVGRPTWKIVDRRWSSQEINGLGSGNLTKMSNVICYTVET